MTTASTAHLPLSSAFPDPVFDSQSVFRDLMLAIAYPGRLIAFDRTVDAPAPLAIATTALCLTLMDFDTSLWLDARSETDGTIQYLRFHCGTPLVPDTASARFAVIAEPLSMPRLSEFHQGDVEYPDRSTTLIIQVPSLENGPRTSWTGPGIKTCREPAIAGLPVWFWSDWDLQREIYPLGIDVFFACAGTIVGLPRTIRVES